LIIFFDIFAMRRKEQAYLGSSIAVDEQQTNSGFNLG